MYEPTKEERKQFDKMYNVPSGRAPHIVAGVVIGSVMILALAIGDMFLLLLSLGFAAVSVLGSMLISKGSIFQPRDPFKGTMHPDEAIALAEKLYGSSSEDKDRNPYA